jgi:hypothetical protein
MKTCLNSYGISRIVLREIFNGASPGKTGLSQAKLKTAGEQCWKSSEKGLAATAIEKIDSCLVSQGVHTANTGSALADVLLELDTHTAKAQNALRFCLRT